VKHIQGLLTNQSLSDGYGPFTSVAQPLEEHLDDYQ